LNLLTSPNHTLFSFTRTSSNTTSSPAVGGGTGFLIREPFTQLPTSLTEFSSFESSAVTLKLPHSKISVFNIYRTPSSSTFSKPFSVFLDEFNSSLSFTATTPHEFIITGDFNIHLDNLSDHTTSQFLYLLSSFNLMQHVNFPTHNQNHILLTLLLHHLCLLHTVLHLITSRSSLNCLLTAHHCLLQRSTHSAVIIL